LPSEWEDEWRQKFAMDSESEKIGVEKRRQILELKLTDTNRKLDLLLDGLLDQTIDQETYRKKKNTLSEIKRQTDEEKKDSLSGKNTRLERMKEFIDSAFQAHKIARADNACEDLAIFAKRIGSNFFLKERRLSAVFREPFQTLCATPPAQSQTPDAATNSLSAGLEGIEPPLELLESPGLPLTYSPSVDNTFQSLDYIKGRGCIQTILREEPDCLEDLVKCTPISGYVYIKRCFGYAPDDGVNRCPVLCRRIVIKFCRYA
jgi:hypothetical protein